LVYEEYDSYRGTKSRPVLFMGGEDMGRLGPAAGITIDLSSPHGHVRGADLPCFELPPGNLMAYYAEANVLMGRESDPRSKMPAFQSVPVAIPKAS